MVGAATVIKPWLHQPNGLAAMSVIAILLEARDGEILDGIQGLMP